MAIFFVDPTFKWTLSNAIVRVEYQVDRGNPPNLHYDGKRGTYSLPNYAANKGRSGQWQVVEFFLHDTLFRNAQNGGADFRVYGNANGFYLRRITVSHHQRGRVPSRPASTSSNLLDLTIHYNSGIRPYLPGADLDAVTNIQQIIRDVTGIEFDARGVVTMSRRDEESSRIAQTTIPINRRVLLMHFLQSAYSTERDGTQIGSYVIKFSDGIQEELPLIYGHNVRAERGDYKPTQEAQRVFWSDERPQTPAKLQVFVLTWTNPWPESEVKSVGFVSAGTRSVPHLLAITIE